MKGFIHNEDYQMAIYGCRKLYKQSSSFALKGFANTYFSFSQFYPTLDPNLRLYYKKASLKEKSLIYKSHEIQVGCQTYECAQQNQRLFLLVAVTNVTRFKMRVVAEAIYQEDLKVQLVKNMKNQLTPGQQSRMCYKVNLFDVFEHSLGLFRLSYILNEQIKNICLLLPIQKFKFFRNMVYDPSILERPYCTSIVRQFEKDERILPELSKIQYYFPNAILNRDLNQVHCLFKFRGVLYQVTIIQDYNHQLRVKLNAPIKEKIIGERFVQDFKFFFSKSQNRQ